MPRYTGFNHLAMVTGDMDRTIRFWRDLLGLPLVAGLGRPGFRQYFFAVSEKDMLGFFEWDGVTPIAEKDHGAPVKGPAAFDHVSLGVAGDEDLWEIKDRLEAAGFWASEIVDHGFIHSLYSFDPNGVAIEFSADTPEADLRQSPRMADRRPSAIALEGPCPTPGVWPAVTNPTPRDQWTLYPGEGEDFLHRLKNAWQDRPTGPCIAEPELSEPARDSGEDRRDGSGGDETNHTP